MKFTASRLELSDRLQTVLSVISGKTTLPILANVLVTAEDETISLSATDLDVSIQTGVPGKVSKSGQTTVPARTFADIIRELPGEEISCSEQNNRIEIRTPSGQYKISGMAPDEFPRLPEISGAAQVTIPAPELVEMIKRTVYAVSTDESRPALNGLLWQADDQEMHMVATDGHRLARYSVATNRLAGAGEDLIIPAKTLNLIAKLAADQEDDISLSLGEKNVIFHLNNATLSTRLIEGPYPNYRQVIPKGNDKLLKVQTEELAGAVRRVSILSNSLTRQVKFQLSNDGLELSATNQDVGGEAKERVTCQYNGDDLEIGYNATYVLDILKNMNAQEVEIALSSSISAGVVKACDGPNKDNYLCLIMPLRLAE